MELENFSNFSSTDGLGNPVQCIGIFAFPGFSAITGRGNNPQRNLSNKVQTAFRDVWPFIIRNRAVSGRNYPSLQTRN